MASTHVENIQPPPAEAIETTLLQRKGASMPASPTSSTIYSIQMVSTATYQRQDQEAQELFNQRIETLCREFGLRSIPSETAC